MVIKAMDREAVDKVEMDNVNRRPCKLLRIMGKQVKAEAVLVVEIFNTVDACRTVPVIKGRMDKGTETTVTEEEMVALIITAIKMILVTNPAGVALAGMVVPAVDRADLLVDLLVDQVDRVADLVDPMADLVEIPVDPEDPMDQGGQDA